MRDKALDYARDNRPAHLARLMELLRIPSVSTQPRHRPDIQRAAEWVAGYLTDIGMTGVALLPTPGAPVVYGEWLAAPGQPTLLLYGHYDVQPVDPVDQWRTPPFEPTLVGDTLFCRGVSDDKGLFFAALAALECYLRTSGRLPINVKVIIEGEEEVSSPHMADFLGRERERLACDVVVIADQPMIDPDTPILMVGLRGNTHLEITVRGPATDLHSGTWGGAVENPLNVLVRMLARLTDEDRRIIVPGFHDRVRPLSDAERARLNATPITDEVVRAITGAPALGGEAGYSLAERMGARPTLEIYGLQGGYTDVGRKSVIPTHATAKVSMRLVPDQEPDAIYTLVADYLRSLAPPTVTVEITSLGGGWPALIDASAPAIQAAAEAYRRVFANPPVTMRGGGSLPIVREMQVTLGASVPIALIGFGLPDDNLHAPNEKLHLPGFYRGIEMVIEYLTLLATSASV